MLKYCRSFRTFNHMQLGVRMFVSWFLPGILYQAGLAGHSGLNWVDRCWRRGERKYAVLILGFIWFYSICIYTYTVIQYDTIIVLWIHCMMSLYSVQCLVCLWCDFMNDCRSHHQLPPHTQTHTHTHVNQFVKLFGRLTFSTNESECLSSFDFLVVYMKKPPFKKWDEIGSTC